MRQLPSKVAVPPGRASSSSRGLLPPPTSTNTPYAIAIAARHAAAASTTSLRRFRIRGRLSGDRDDSQFACVMPGVALQPAVLGTRQHLAELDRRTRRL